MQRQRRTTRIGASAAPPTNRSAPHGVPKRRLAAEPARAPAVYKHSVSCPRAPPVGGRHAARSGLVQAGGGPTRSPSLTMLEKQEP
ncbi:hypothetical protein NDU88_006935 [Pleurodeles waltl]|uniref:Uncharacterized protein n=1 Tax=Pleurodeles waltl TaxID=8319 RepID=A0AAV7LQK4_PLEWA|nr:hypothetical protein NDU88_006935 [Pleurodeles waltl]